MEKRTIRIMIVEIVVACIVVARVGVYSLVKPVAEGLLLIGVGDSWFLCSFYNVKSSNRNGGPT